MTKQKITFQVKNDEKLDFVKSLMTKAVETFCEALPDCEDKVSFKAIQIKKLEDENEKAMILDVLMTGLAMEIDEKAPKDGFNYNCSCEDTDDDIIIWLHASKGKQDVLVAPSGMGHLTAEEHIKSTNIVYDA